MQMTKRKSAKKWQYEVTDEQDIESFEKISNRRVPPELMSTRQLGAWLKTAASRRVHSEIGCRRSGRRNKRYW